MSSQPPTRHVDEDLIARALAALFRARKRAEEIARATDTYLIEAVDGKPVRVRPPAKTSDTPSSRPAGGRQG